MLMVSTHVLLYLKAILRFSAYSYRQLPMKSNSLPSNKDAGAGDDLFDISFVNWHRKTCSKGFCRPRAYCNLHSRVTIILSVLSYSLLEKKMQPTIMFVVITPSKRNCWFGFGPNYENCRPIYWPLLVSWSSTPNHEIMGLELLHFW